MKTKITLLLFLIALLPLSLQAINTWQTAVTINNGETKSGTLSGETGKTENWYKIVVPENGTIALTATPSASLRIQYIDLYTLKENKTVSRNYINMTNSSEAKTLTVDDVAAGTYYVRIDRWTGNGGYSLKYTYTENGYSNDAEPNNSYDKAKLLTSGTTVQGHLGYFYNSEDRDTEDWYKIVVPENGTIALTATPSASLRIQYIDLYTLKENKTVSRNYINMTNSSEAKTLTVDDVAAGTYYVRIDRWTGNGGYSLKYTYTENGYSNDAEPNNSYDKAKLLTSGTTVQGHLGYFYNSEDRDTEDWYKIVVPENGTIALTATPSASLRIQYIDLYTLKENKTVSRNYINMTNSSEAKTLTVDDVAAGTYYVRIDRWTGNGGYSLIYTYTENGYSNDAEPNNSYDKAKLLTSGTTVQGHLGYFYNSEDRDTEDWYKIVVPENGTIALTATPSASLRIQYIDLYTLKENKTVSRNYINMTNSSEAKTLTVDDVAAGTYYVRIDRWNGNGGYTLKYSYNKNKFKNDIEPNDTYEQGQRLGLNETITGHLGYRYQDLDKEDWYKISIKEKGIANFTLKPDTTSSLSINLIQLFKITEDGIKSKGYTQVRREEKQLTINDIEAGEYALKIDRWTGTGAYTLTFGHATPLAGSPIKVDVIGQPSVRLGAPTRFTIKMTNESGERTEPFMLAVGATEDIHFIGAEVPYNSGIQKLKINEELESANSTAQSFFVPYLDPFESYSFVIIVEGAVNGSSFIKGAKVQQQTEVLPALVIGAVVSYGTGIITDKIQDWVVDKVNDEVDLNPQEAQEYARAMHLTVEDLGMEKQKDGIGVFATKSVIKQTVEKATKLNPVTNLIYKVGNAAETAASVSQSLRRRLWYWIYSEIGLIDKKIAVADGKLAADKIVSSWDPNEKTGPIGFGETNAIAKPQRMDYTIFFENKKEATAPAYRVYIEDTLSEVYDLSSVEFGTTSHSGDDYYWHMEQDGNKLIWSIEGIELPPNITPPEGEGYVTFSVELKPDIASGVPIVNSATIIFDKNPAITTNIWTNVIDMLPPTTRMNPVSYLSGDKEVTVSCTSADNTNGSGVNRYLFYVSENEEDFRFIEESNENSIDFPINLEKVTEYRFYAIAIDNVGNVEQNIPDFVSFKSATSVNSVKADILNVYPNPSTDGLFYISASNKNLEVSSYSVYSSLGQLITSKELSAFDDKQIVKIDLSDYPTGVYHTTIKSGTKNYNIKLIKR